jgi:hypothetical protein
MDYANIMMKVAQEASTIEARLATNSTALGTNSTALGTLRTAVDALTAVNTYTPTDAAHVDQALTVSGGATPSITFTDIDTVGAAYAVVIVNNKGAGTTVSVNVYGQIGTVAYTDAPIVTALALTATPGATCKAAVINPCGYDKIKVVVANADAGNATTFDAVIRVFK